MCGTTVHAVTCEPRLLEEAIVPAVDRGHEANDQAAHNRLMFMQTAKMEHFNSFGSTWLASVCAF